jgi:Kef-type K+ transport system membrane component KefB
MSLETELVSLFFVILVAAAAPLLADASTRVRLPQVALLLVGGVIIGPELLDLADPDALSLLSELGLGFLFLLAGYEIEPALLRDRATRRASWAWLTAAAVAVPTVTALHAVGLVAAEVTIAIALTTTAFGTILPIATDAGLLKGRLRAPIVANGAIGEVAPIIAMALLLTTTGEVLAVISLVIFFGVAYLFSLLPRHSRARPVIGRVHRLSDETSQALLRWVLVLLIGLLAAATVLDLDAVLGAFAAGFVLRLTRPEQFRPLELKLETVGYGFFIPVFFVVSGLTLDVRAIVSKPVTVVLLFVLLVVVRGGTVWLWHSNLDKVGRRRVSLFSATTLPMLIALSEVSVRTELMSRESAAIMIGAGVISVLVLPALALRGMPGRPTSPPEPRQEDELSG